MADTTTDQGAQQIRMGRVVAAGKLLVVRELRLHEGKLLLAHHRWHLGDGDPLLWLGERMSTTSAPHRGQRRVPLMRRRDTAASDVDRSCVGLLIC
ncbi:MAG: hypothetical protein AUH89_00595 [Ktedonobacter sp. 13_1_40CM_4_52_4]|nr:MAG: hypothetical protein AUH89_00595 [Ktedonobacter sp. 13_1_40CM_4_52_4]